MDSRVLESFEEKPLTCLCHCKWRSRFTKNIARESSEMSWQGNEGIVEKALIVKVS